jgi:hypothetical protein
MVPMIPLAHLGGLPIEEVLLPLAYGGTSVWAALRMRLLARASRRRRADASRRRDRIAARGPQAPVTNPEAPGGLR